MGKKSSTERRADPVLDGIFMPFTVLRAPDLKLKAPWHMNFEMPGKWFVFGLLLFSYFCCISGMVYDLILEPPAIGQVIDPETMAQRPQTFMVGRINNQYIVEGLAAGFMFCCGVLGFILLDQSVNGSEKEEWMRTVTLMVGALLVVGTYNISMLFLRTKVPYYMGSANY